MSELDMRPVDLEVPADQRRAVARVLLAAVESLELDRTDTRHIATTSEGFRVPAAVFVASGLEVASPPPGLVDLLAELGERGRAARTPAAPDPVPAAEVAPAEPVEAPPPVEVPAPLVPPPAEATKRKRKNTQSE